MKGRKGIYKEGYVLISSVAVLLGVEINTQSWKGHTYVDLGGLNL